MASFERERETEREREFLFCLGALILYCFIRLNYGVKSVHSNQFPNDAHNKILPLSHTHTQNTQWG